MQLKRSFRSPDVQNAIHEWCWRPYGMGDLGVEIKNILHDRFASEITSQVYGKISDLMFVAEKRPGRLPRNRRFSSRETFSAKYILEARGPRPNRLIFAVWVAFKRRYGNLWHNPVVHHPVSNVTYSILRGANRPIGVLIE